MNRLADFLRAAFKAALIYAAAAWFGSWGRSRRSRNASIIGRCRSCRKTGNDARTMGDALKQLGFSVMVLAAIFADDAHAR